ncbi:4-(cytidine 5'-diphospho)-2-C-methyl-D-erythritol kinase [Gemmatimonas sp.]|uniref:4-(cytidine 5'-diphospho)-2-C-methyl-D-erythritol kinase n=1 Tax=Gemmatimonas sp. TaxID=1962908 RepID=UPI003982FBD2
MIGESRTECAYAKINLVLKLLAREASGYHGIETLFQLLDLHDLVQVRVGTMTPALTCAGPTIPAGGLGAVEQNLAWRAAVAYTAASGWQTGWDIHIEKHIPVGGGLGGGSADAAAVLRALEAMSPTPLGAKQLLALAGTLGADVPFLVSGHSLAWAWGRGDRLLTLPALPRAVVWLATFAEGVNTGAAYGAFAQAREANGETAPAFAYPASAFASWDAIAALAMNDFEPVVSAMHAGVAAILPGFRAIAAERRASGSPAIGMMSGSGATCFLLLSEGAMGLQTDGSAAVLWTSTR